MAEAETTPQYNTWQEAAAGGNLLSYALANRPSLSQIVPGYDPSEPWYQKALDVGSVPARMAWSGVKDIADKVDAAMRSPNLLQDPTAQHGLTEATINLGLGATAAPLRPAGSVGVFGGVKAATADFRALSRAERMYDVAPEDVWHREGWWSGPGAQWRFEIPDEDAKIRTDRILEYSTGGRFGISYGSQHTLDNVLDHKELFDAYPELKNVNVRALPIGDILAGTKGGYAPTTNTIYLAPGTPDSLKSVLLHEVQHVVQNIEGFPRGGMPDEFLPPDFKQQYKQVSDNLRPYTMTMGAQKANPAAVYKALVTQETGNLLPGGYLEEELGKASHAFSPNELKSFRQHYEAKMQLDNMDDEAFKNYERMAGEIEARMVQERRGYDPAESRRVFPPATQGYPTDVSQIIRRNTPLPPPPGFTFIPVDHDPFQ